MNKILPAFIAGIALLLIACNTNKVNNSNPVGADSTHPPVETKAANTSYKPAFPGQTRIAGVTTSSPYDAKMLNDKLTRPWGIACLPDGRFLITEKGGDMRIASIDGSLGAPIKGQPAVNSSGQGGLLGITLDPAFPDNRMVYWTFSLNSPEGNMTAVAKGRLSDDEKQIENASVIFRATPAYNGTLHYGSRIVFDKQGNIIFSTGERSDLQTRPQAQQLNSDLGKVIRITTEGKPAAGNPFLNTGGARPELYLSLIHI